MRTLVRLVLVWTFAVLPMAVNLEVSRGAAADNSVDPATSCNAWATYSWSDNCFTQRGDTSKLVVAIQWIVSGACGGNGIAVDGIFGSDTEHAVTCFQNQHNLVGDGEVGPLTWAALRRTLVPTADNDPDWAYYHLSLYLGASAYSADHRSVFRQWVASGRWYVADPMKMEGAWPPGWSDWTPATS